MQKGGGRAKGNSFERQIAKQVVKAFKTFGIKSDACYRTPSSGGHRYAKKEDPGDLVISKKLRKLFPFLVECKNYSQINLFKLFEKIENHPKSSQFKQWLAQTTAAVNGKKEIHPMLVFKQNSSIVLCAVPAVYPLVANMRGKPQFQMRYRHEDWRVFRFDQLLRQLVKEASSGVE